MGFLSTLYHELFFQPLYNGLIFLTSIIPFQNLGFSIIILTVIVRLIIFPFTHRSIRIQIKMKQIEPELKKIRDEFKNNHQEIARRTMELYRAHGISPFSGFVMLLIQFPILIALYQVFTKDIAINQNFLYSFISFPENINSEFLGFIELVKPSIFLSIVTGVSQFIQMKLVVPRRDKKSFSLHQDKQIKINTFMTYVFPAVIIGISMRFPAALALYWTSSNVFAILHEGLVRRTARNADIKNEQRSTTVHL